MKGERNSLWIDLFERDLDHERDFTQGMQDNSKNPGVLSFNNYALERHLGPELRRHLEDLSADVKKRRKELDQKHPFVHGVADVDKPSPIQVHLRGSPFRLGEEVPARFPSLLVSTNAEPFTQGSGRLELARAIVARMVQVYYAKCVPWDHHNDILQHRDTARDSDRPFAAVIKDLKARGLFEKTLVVCGSEFGRTPVVEVGSDGGSTQNGRDHNPFGFTIWLAGGAIKGGLSYGATDDFGFRAVEKPVHVHDLHATILHLLGIDHTKLTYRYSGRDFRLTDVSGIVNHDWIA